jgi:RNase H-like domain found in reverse transcriptase
LEPSEYADCLPGTLCIEGHHLVKLTRKGAQWEFGPLQETAMDNIKQALLTSLALQPINYKSDAPVILSVDTSHIAIGFILSQCDLDNVKLRYHARFRSITLNELESQFSQPKLGLYRLYRSL